MNKPMVDISQKGNVSNAHLGEWLFPDQLLGGLGAVSSVLIRNVIRRDRAIAEKMSQSTACRLM